MKFINHEAKCEYWNAKLLIEKDQLPELYPQYYKKWKAIDRTKDKSLSASEFRLWLYLRKVSETSKIARSLGKLGGEATKAKLGVDHFKRISKLGLEVRRRK